MKYDLAFPLNDLRVYITLWTSDVVQMEDSNLVL